MKGKTILVTGGTGSFGHVFVKKALDEFGAAKVIVFSRDEFKQYQMRRRFDSERLRFFIGDVRDRDRLYRALNGVDFVVHAAALKQVPTAEYNPIEAVQTNVLGAQNVINASLDSGVRKVISLSSDKACNPVNLYGATKLCADKLFIAANSYSGSSGTRFSVVRYGNVLGSRGSVIPLFRRLAIEGGPIPITDERSTRFWITLSQASDFVASCLSEMSGGELYIPKIPSMKIVDLAEALAPGVKKEVIGLRPGEKLHEVMVSKDDSRNLFEKDDRYVKLPDFASWSIKRPADAVVVEPGFEYSSDKNHWWLDTAGLLDLLSEDEAVK